MALVDVFRPDAARGALNLSIPACWLDKVWHDLAAS